MSSRKYRIYQLPNGDYAIKKKVLLWWVWHKIGVFPKHVGYQAGCEGLGHSKLVTFQSFEQAKYWVDLQTKEVHKPKKPILIEEYEKDGNPKICDW